jgi:hypothetical protein
VIVLDCVYAKQDGRRRLYWAGAPPHAALVLLLGRINFCALRLVIATVRW